MDLQQIGPYKSEYITYGISYIIQVSYIVCIHLSYNWRIILLFDKHDVIVYSTPQVFENPFDCISVQLSWIW
jgi:hypothetical protein